MPYISTKERIKLKTNPPGTPRDLSYLFTMTIKSYIDHYGLDSQVINDILGSLEAAKLEFYRRIVVPYDSQKLFDNGDVY